MKTRTWIFLSILLYIASSCLVKVEAGEVEQVCKEVAQSFDVKVGILSDPEVQLAVFDRGVYRCTVKYSKRVSIGRAKFTDIPALVILTYNKSNKMYIYKTVRTL